MLDPPYIRFRDTAADAGSGHLRRRQSAVGHKLFCGRHHKDAIIRDYAESAVAIADIKIAVRSQKTGKSQEFLKRALAPCDTVQVELLAKAAANGMDAIRDYLLTTAPWCSAP